MGIGETEVGERDQIKSIGGKLKCLLKTGACLIQGLLKTGWTVHASQIVTVKD